MRGIAKATVLGRVGVDPEIRNTNSGKLVANLSVATNNRRSDGSEETFWHRVTVFDKLAEVVQKYVKKGNPIYVEGRLVYRKWEKDGVERTSAEIIGYDLQLLGDKSRDESGAGANGNVAQKSGGQSLDHGHSDEFEDDIPF